MITENNYEQHVLDYLEGNLTPDQHQKMELFLDQHPDIAAEIYGLQEVVLTPDLQVQFEPKAQLKQSEQGLGMYWGRYTMLVLLLLVGRVIWCLYNSSGIPKKLPSTQPMEQLTAPALMVEESSMMDPVGSNHLPTEKEDVPTPAVHSSATTPRESPHPPRSTPKHPLPQNISSDKTQVPNLDTTTSQPTPPALLMAEHPVPPEVIKPQVEPRPVVPTAVLNTIDVKKILPTKIQSKSSGQVLLAAHIQPVEAHPSQRGKRLPTASMWKRVAQAIVPESFMVNN